MPFVDLPESGVRLSWRSSWLLLCLSPVFGFFVLKLLLSTGNLPSDDLAHLKTSSKPLIVLLPPVMLAARHLEPQFRYPGLTDNYDMIAFDWIGCGETECPEYITPERAAHHDTWVDAALLARFAQKLLLPPFHIFAVQNNSVNAALRFSMLFPSHCLSLTLCSIPNHHECVLPSPFLARNQLK